MASGSTYDFTGQNLFNQQIHTYEVMQWAFSGSAYRFAGSLTTPPCSGGLVWIVSAMEHSTATEGITRKAYMSTAQYDDLFTNAYKLLNTSTGNARDIQALNNRVVECVDLTETTFTYTTDTYQTENNNYWWVLWVCLTLLVWIIILAIVFFVLKKIGGKPASEEIEYTQTNKSEA